MSKKKPTPKQIIKHLKRVISHLDDLFEKGDPCIHPDTGKIVSDAQYDAYRHDLEVLLEEHAPSDPFLSKPTSSNSSSNISNKIKHDPPLTSISKANGTVEEKDAILDKWMAKAADGLDYKYDELSDIHDKFVTTWKHDGVSLALYYEKGVLVRAGLRSDNGVDGENVTEHCKHIKGIPLKLDKPITCSIRGEVECLKSDFKTVNIERAKAKEKTYANPRNFTAGSMGLDDPTQLKGRKLSFIAFSIENLEDPPYETEIERSNWCNKELGVPFVQARPYKRESLDKMESTVNGVDYEVDGVIVSVNNISDQKALGHRGGSPTGNPVGKIAWKFKEQNVVVEVKKIEWNTGRSGKVTPVLHFDGVHLAGTTVSKCTAHNVGLINREKIGVGALVRIEKSGKIIPKVIGVERPAKNVTWPDKCPVCGGKLEYVENPDDPSKAELMCNNNDCPAKNVGAFVYYLNKMGVKGLAENVVGQLIDNAVIDSLDDFYRLTINDLLAIDITQRTALLTIARIHMVNQPEKMEDRDLAKATISAIKKKKEVQLTTFLAALGISGASKGTAKNISDKYTDVNEILKLSKDDFAALPDVGDKTAENLYNYFSANHNMIKALMKHLEIKGPVIGKLTGKSFVFTGKVSTPRKELEKMVEENGGKASSSVSKNTSYLVAGDEAGSKLDKAQKLGVQVISEDEFLKMV